MRRITRSNILLVSVQAICLGIGFWFQHQLAVSTTERQAAESTWQQLSANSESFVQSVGKRSDDELLLSKQSTIEPKTATETAAKNLAFLLIDKDGKIIDLTESAINWRRGDRVVMISDRHNPTNDGISFGRITTSLGERKAVFYPFGNRNCQIVAYETVPSSPLWKTSLASSLGLVSGLGFIWTLSLSSIALFLMLSRISADSNQEKKELDHEALRNSQDLVRTRDAVIFGLAKLAESRDPETGHHLERISLYTTRFATALRPYPKYQRIVIPAFVRLLGISSVLHDIGKVGVEDTVLLKRGSLTDTERSRMQQHTLVGGDCLSEIEERLGASNFLQTAREIALHHHERWDGTGYPHGLAGEDIPLAARIVSIADVYDALKSKRVYKEALSHETCVEQIRAGAGTQFDPELVEVFLEIESEFAAISRRFGNTTSDETDRNEGDREELNSESSNVDSHSENSGTTQREPSIVSVA